MTQGNPLVKYFRQPKIFIQLPSKGLFYEPGALKGDYNNVPIFGMSGMDEILLKTPDALFNGEASSKVIESCCSYIVDAKKMPSIDVDAVLVAIRMATYGEEMTVTHSCNNCKAVTDYKIDLKTIIEYFSSINFDNIVNFNSMVIKLKPLTYEEMTKFNIENFKLQRTLYQLEGLSEEEQQAHISEIYKKLAEIQVELFMFSIESVQTQDALVTDKEMIKEWLQNSEKDVYKEIKEHLDKNKNIWSIPKQHVKCSECGHEESFSVSVDQSNFFA